MSAIGLIIGNGNVKAWCKHRFIRFPAIAAPWSPTSYASVTGGGPSPIVLENGGAWLVGAEAQTFARERMVAILDKQRYCDPSFVALARVALQSIGAGGSQAIMTGMPAAWFADKRGARFRRRCDCAAAHAAGRCMSTARAISIKLPAGDPHSAVILAWLEHLLPGDVSALVRQALACSPLVQGTDVRPHLERIEAKLDLLLAQPTLGQPQAGETLVTPPERLSLMEHEALTKLFDFGG